MKNAIEWYIISTYLEKKKISPLRMRELEKKLVSPHPHDGAFFLVISVYIWNNLAKF